ncbi:MAG: alpha/beta hydrolase, partial [Rhodospirillaceae bacterium]|nr:alpha/beta hydrolase [Rhodospirillaceae bacterium]
MATIVLVHGAWHGGWCWRRVAPLLAREGHRVLTPTLTGLGERAHLARPEVDLETHIADLEGVFRFEEVAEAVVVAHSYAGFPATALADRMGERVRRLVYLDAFVPGAGDSFMSLLAPATRDAFRRRAAANDPSWLVPPLRPRHYGVSDPADQAWLAGLLVGHPLASFEQPLRLLRPDREHPARSYVYCSAPAMGDFDRFAERAREEPGWRYHALATGHDAMVTEPEALADII